MRFSVWPAPHRPWADVLEIVSHCDGVGWDGAYFPDHFMPNDPAGQPLDGPVLESWSVVAGLAARTRRLRLGSLVSGNLYRHPAVVANAAATIDQISDGRFVLGLGAGWQVNEHAAYGIDLGDVRGRLDRFEEACAVVKALLTEPRANFAGRYYHLADAPCDPKPVQSPLPLLIGGGGEQRTLRVAARYADEWNVWSTPEVMRHKSEVLARHCAELGRAPAGIARSTQALVFLSTDEAALAPLRDREMRTSTMIGTPAEMVEMVAAYRDAGVDELVVPDWTMGSAAQARDTLDLFWTEVAAPFR
jgi:F420-dependent oxidoreductase-like protein